MSIIDDLEIEHSANKLKQATLKHLDVDDAVLMSLCIFSPLLIQQRIAHKSTIFKQEYLKELYDIGSISLQWTLLEFLFASYSDEIPELKVIYPRLKELSNSFGSDGLDLSDVFYAVHDLFFCMERKAFSKLEMLDVIFKLFYQKDTDNYFDYSANEFMFYIIGREVNGNITAPIDNVGNVIYGLIKNRNRLQQASTYKVEWHNVKNRHILLLIMIIMQEGSPKLSSMDTLVLAKTTKSTKADLVLLSLNNKLNPEKDLSHIDNEQFEFGIPQKNRPEFLYIQHAITFIKEGGNAFIITPVSVLYRTGSEKAIREKLIEANLIDTLIFLPKNYPSKTSSPMAILIVRKNRINSDTLLINAEAFANENNQIDYEAIREVMSSRESIPHKSYSTTHDAIVKNDFNLNLKHYIQPENKDVIEPEDNRDTAELIAEFIERERLIEEKYQSILNAL